MAETVGSLIDKISIMQLKAFQMEKQTLRKDASEEHRRACEQRLTVLREQVNDLNAELTELFDLVMSGKKKLKVYRQFKMYNDPSYRPSK